jgi:hypothetical protein
LENEIDLESATKLWQSAHDEFLKAEAEYEAARRAETTRINRRNECQKVEQAAWVRLQALRKESSTTISRNLDRSKEGLPG